MDSGPFEAVPSIDIDASGNFSFATKLLLDHSADGPHTVHLRATDRAGNVSPLTDFSFTLDTVAPTVSVASPASGLATNQNVTVTGQATDDRSGVAQLQVAVDGGAFSSVSFDASGSFSFATALALDHSADGPHTVHLWAADRAGNVSAVSDFSFTLDTVAPTVSVASPASGLATNHNITLTGQATDDRSGVAQLQAAVDGGAFAPVSIDASGNFNFTPALRQDGSQDGPHVIHLRAADRVGNVSAAQDVPFVLDTVAPRVAVTGVTPGPVTNGNVTVTGQVSDDTSGVATLQAAVDGGAFAPVSFDASGDFTFTTALALDHSADGPHTAHLRAYDRAGNLSEVTDVAFTLDTVPPTVSVTAPASGLAVNHNLTITGVTADDRSGVASLEAAVDAGGYAPVALDASADFSLTTALPLGHSADGSHTVRLRATDRAGNVSAVADLSFTLDTVAPVVTVSSPAAGLTVDHNVTVTAQAADALSGVASAEAAVDGGMFAPLALDASGNFSLTTDLPLDGGADGPHAVHLRAADLAGNVSGLTDVSFTLQTGSLLREGTRFNVTRRQPVTIPQQASSLTFNYSDLSFDTSSQGRVKDAFEVALVDGAGNSLVPTIAAGRDAFFNVSEGQAAALGAWATADGQTVSLDLTHVTPGTGATLVFRLVNNDGDVNTSVRLGSVQVVPRTGQPVGPGGQPTAVLSAAPASLDFAHLADVTASVQGVYGRTSFDEATHVLSADLGVQNAGQYPVDAPLVVVIDHLSDPSVQVRGADGLTPDGRPYYDLSSLVAGGKLAAGGTTGSRTLTFYNPGGGQFTYDLVVLGQLNRPPAFTSSPRTEALIGHSYVYQATATDPDGDPLTFSLLAGPDGMTVDAATGKVTWSPSAADAGNQSVALRVEDGRGGAAEQRYTLAVITPPPNRPPVFTSSPVMAASVVTPYTYPATATDPDDDPLTFSVVSGPQGLSIDPSTGLVTWTPGGSQVGPANVTIQVSDGLGGTATQSYVVTVQQQPGNHPPLIVSDPVTQFNLPPSSNPAGGSVNPTSIQLTLTAGQTSEQTVTLNGPLPGGTLTSTW
jgi:hypothetical protein